MDFNSLFDPFDIARATAALDAAWARIGARSPALRSELAREHLASLIATLIPVAIDEEDLAERALKRFEQSFAQGLRIENVGESGSMRPHRPGAELSP